MKSASLAESIYGVLSGRRARLLGLILSVALILLVCRVLYLERGRLGQIEVDFNFLLAAVLCVAVVVIGNLLGSIGSWLLLRRHSGALTIPFLVSVNGIAQLAKYLPGNVLHLVGRFFLIKQRAGAAAALSFSIYELLLLCLAGAGLGLLYVHYFQPSQWSLPLLSLISLVMLAAGVVVLFRAGFLSVTVAELSIVLALYLLSFFAHGVALNVLLEYVFDVPNANALLCAILFALAFVVGFITPGASGGLGVREFVFMVLAQPIIDTTAAVSAIVMFRFFSIAGDLFFATIALGTRKWYRVNLLQV